MQGNGTLGPADHKKNILLRREASEGGTRTVNGNSETNTLVNEAAFFNE